MTPRRVVVTGGSGFLGSEVVRLALESNWDVTALARSWNEASSDARNVACDITDARCLTETFRGADVVVHCAGMAHVFGAAAKDTALLEKINGVGSEITARAAREAGVDNIVLASSVSVYGDYPGETCDETAICYPRGPYATSKLLGEMLAQEVIAREGGSLAILRFATIYGEGDRGNIARLIRALAMRRYVTIGSGHNRKSFIYKEDAARACLAAMEYPVRGVEVFNVTAAPVSITEVVDTICESLSRKAPRLGLSETIVRFVAAVASHLGDPGQVGRQLQKLIKNDVYDATKFNKWFDFESRISLEEGIRREVEWMRISKKM